MEDISREIIKEAAAGGLEAFENIYRITSTFVYTVALRITQSRQDAEEVTQDVFLKVHSNLGRFDFRSSLRTWIYRIAVNLAINRYNKMKREKANIIEDEIDIDAIKAAGSAGEAGPAQEKEDLQVLLKRLNPDQKACLLLREVEGLNYKEIADVLKIPLNTVRTRLKRARLALAAAVREETKP